MYIGLAGGLDEGLSGGRYVVTGLCGDCELGC